VEIRATSKSGEKGKFEKWREGVNLKIGKYGATLKSGE